MDYFTKRQYLLESILEFDSLLRSYLNNPTLDVVNTMQVIALSDYAEISTGVLKSVLKLSGTRTTRAIYTLNEAGLTYHVIDPADKRRAIVRLTTKGHELRSKYFSILLMGIKK